MRFWIATLMFNLLIPIIMLIVGILYLKKPMKKISWTHGYRTDRSMQNQETWEFAQKHFGNTCYRSGILFTVLTFILMFSVLGQTKQVVGILGNVLGTVEGFLMVYVLVTTENALKKKYDG